MKKLFLTIVLAGVTIYFSPAQRRVNLQPGMQAPEWRFNDANNNEFTMNSWPGMVLQLNYVDPDESDLNDAFNDAVKKAIDIDKRINRELFKGFGIVDCKSSWKPNRLIRMVAGNKARKYDTTVLFDYDGTLQELCGLPPDSYSVIILDKNRVCRAIYRGEIPEADFEKIIRLIIDLTNE